MEKPVLDELPIEGDYIEHTGRKNLYEVLSEGKHKTKEAWQTVIRYQKVCEQTGRGKGVIYSRPADITAFKNFSVPSRSKLTEMNAAKKVAGESLLYKLFMFLVFSASIIAICFAFSVPVEMYNLVGIFAVFLCVDSLITTNYFKLRSLCSYLKRCCHYY